jgi:hypothetical protein
MGIATDPRLGSQAKGRPLANRGRRLAAFGSWQLQHRRMLTCVYSSERHNCAVGKFESVVMDPGRLDVDFPEPREGASRPLRPRHPFARIPRRCGKREFSTGPQANSDAGCIHICEAPRQSIGKTRCDQSIRDDGVSRLHLLQTIIAHCRPPSWSACRRNRGTCPVVPRTIVRNNAAPARVRMERGPDRAPTRAVNCGCGRRNRQLQRKFGRGSGGAPSRPMRNRGRTRQDPAFTRVGATVLTAGAPRMEW